MVLPRRKKWAEAEERTLIDKYGEMVCDGTLEKMKTREKKFKPIALHVNSVHHVCDSAAYPWQWTWKDVSTKVQNMRHQYLLVKQKIKIPQASNSAEVEVYEWEGGVSHWANFTRYKEVFGDIPASHGGGGNHNEFVDGALCENSDSGAVLLESENRLQISEFGQIDNSSGGCLCSGIDGDENRIPSLELEDNREEEDNNNYGGDFLFHEANDDSFYAHEQLDADASDSRKKGKATNGGEKRMFGFLSSRLKQLRDIEAQVEHNEADRLQKRKRVESIVMEKERERKRKVGQREKQSLESEKSRDELFRQRMQEWESTEKEREERERERSERELIQEREWEERMKRTRYESNNRIEGMLRQHQVETRQIHARILQEQQNLTSQLLSVVSEHAGATSSVHYFSQIIQNLLLHVNNLGQGDGGEDGETQDEQFVVDR